MDDIDKLNNSGAIPPEDFKQQVADMQSGGPAIPPAKFKQQAQDMTAPVPATDPTAPIEGMSADLPNANDLFPADLPNANDLFPVDPAANRTPNTSPIQDLIFSDWEHNPAAKVLKAFGQGAADNWGVSKAESLTEETTAYLKANKMFDEWNQSNNAFVKAANQALFRPAAMQLIKESRDAVGLIHGVGAGFAGGLAAVGEFGRQIGDPDLEMRVGTAMEAFPTGFRAPVGIPKVPHAILPHLESLTNEINTAKRLNVLNGEDAYFGIRPSPPISVDNPAPKPPAPYAGGMPVDLFEGPRKPTEPAAPIPPTVEPAVAKPSSIAEDVAGKLTAAGRPADEAALGGELTSAYHETRAARFGGAIGTAEDSYHAVGADIRAANPTLAGGTEPLKPSDGGGAPPAPEPPKPAPAPAPAAVEPPKAAPPVETAPSVVTTALKKMGHSDADIAGMSPADKIEIFAKGDVKTVEQATTVDGIKIPPEKPTPEAVKEATATTATNVWDGLAETKQAKTGDGKVTSGYNNARDRNGKKIRGKNTQVWATGNMVDVGLVKDLLITDKNADGSWKLVSKPDEAGQSKTYDFAPHEGISRNEGTVDFLKTAGHLQPEAARPVPPAEAAKPEAAKPKTLRGRAAADPQTWSLFEFLSKEGGLAHTADLHSIFGNTRGPLIPGFGPLLRKNGMSMDTALTKAKEAGYIIDPNDIQHVAGNANTGEKTITVNHLHDMIDAESRGQKNHILGREPVASAVDLEEEAHHIRGALDQELAARGDPEASPAISDRVVEMMHKEGETSVLAAYERATSEDYFRHERLADERIDEQLAHEWDATHSGATPEDGGELQAARGQAGSPGEGASGSDGTAPRGDSEVNRGPLNSGEGQPAKTEELTYDQRKRGQITLRDGFRAVITLFKSANASTFIHETGHHWLANLISDALHPKAPADIKADAKIVMDWLGVERPGDIKVSHHEKFARGFERYMMEGKAPSAALANVFAKFKAWLTQIYSTVTKLKSPINNDIRGVFDRMISMPAEVKIEPDVAPKSFADIHEADATVTDSSPHMAHPAAETAQGERDTVATGHLPQDIENARLTDVKSEAERRAPRDRESSGDPTAAESGSEGPGDTSPSGTVSEGRTENAPDGDPPPPRVRPTENPQSPHDEFPEKAGNIVLKNLNTSEDLNAIIRQSAKDNGDYEHVRGPIDDAQVLALAEAAGIDTAYINARALGQAWTAPEIVALRRLLIQSAQSVFDLAKKAAEGAEADIMAYVEAKNRHILIQERVSDVTAQAGRALRAFQARFTEGLSETLGLNVEPSTGKTLFQLQQEAKFLAGTKTPGQASKFIHDTGKGTFRSAVLEYYVNALISGPVTHGRYIVSNAVNALWTPLVEIPLAAGVGFARELATGHPIERVHLGEAGAQLYGLIQGSRNGLYAAIEAFTSGVSPALPTERVSAQFSEASRAIPGPVGSVIRVPGKSVAGIHSFFKSLRYEQNINGIAYRTAANEGLAGKAFSDRVADLTTTPSEAMMREATNNALRELYMSPTDYHSSMGDLIRFTNRNLAAKIIVPFMKIGSQITRGAFVDKFVTGLASSEMRSTLSSNSPAADMASGRVMAGTALFAASFGLAAEGLMTGDGPSDPRTRAIWLLTHKPNTIQIGDMSFAYGNTGPLGMLMRTAANMHELGHAMDEKGIAAVGVDFMEAMAKSVLDETFLRGFKDMLDAMFHPKEYGGRYAISMVTNWIPFSVGLSQVARKIDPFQHETKGVSTPVTAILEAAQAKIPWLSRGLMPRRDMFGEPIRWDGPNPNYANDPVVKAMDALNGSGVGKMSKKINGVDLTEQQYDDVSRIAGRDAKMQLNARIGIIDNPQVPAGVRLEMIHKAISDARHRARQLVMMQSIGSDNDIMKQSMTAKIDKKTVLAPQH